MPDGYGDGLPSWAIDVINQRRRSAPDSKFLWALAVHLRAEHDMPLHRIAKRTGLKFNDLREKLK